MRYLPTDTEQRWLIDRLVDLIGDCGHDHYTRSPIVEPTPKFFPDPWSFSHKGLDRMVRRLMQYAGLGELDVGICTFEEVPSWVGGTQPQMEQSVAGLFLGINKGYCLFGFNEQSNADSEYAAGVMSHEVAHAFRAHHGLGGSNSKEEEELITDVTASYLGFGILATNNSYRYRTKGWVDGSLAYRSESTQMTGYLPPQAWAFLLGIQMTLQNLSSDEQARLRKYLEPDQDSFTKMIVKSVLKEEVDIAGLLEVCPEPGSEPIKGIEEILLPLPEYNEPPKASYTKQTEKIRDFNSGLPVFRVCKTRSSKYAVRGFILGAVSGLLLAAFMEQPAIALLGIIVGTAMGAAYGQQIRWEECSEPECSAVIEPGTSKCSNCGGKIVGSISDAKERFEAREKYYQDIRRGPSED